MTTLPPKVRAAAEEGKERFEKDLIHLSGMEGEWLVKRQVMERLDSFAETIYRAALAEAEEALPTYRSITDEEAKAGEQSSELRNEINGYNSCLLEVDSAIAKLRGK